MCVNGVSHSGDKGYPGIPGNPSMGLPGSPGQQGPPGPLGQKVKSILKGKNSSHCTMHKYTNLTQTRSESKSYINKGQSEMSTINTKETIGEKKQFTTSQKKLLVNNQENRIIWKDPN